jgi:hypothetical protein
MKLGLAGLVISAMGIAMHIPVCLAKKIQFAAFQKMLFLVQL